MLKYRVEYYRDEHKMVGSLTPAQAFDAAMGDEDPEIKLFETEYEAYEAARVADVAPYGSGKILNVCAALVRPVNVDEDNEVIDFCLQDPTACFAGAWVERGELEYQLREAAEQMIEHNEVAYVVLNEKGVRVQWDVYERDILLVDFDPAEYAGVEDADDINVDDIAHDCLDGLEKIYKSGCEI